jgi:ABC-type dipeptide/oligopeptide/nickel transport system permease subunit
LLGTNDVGQDILSELIFGSRISLTIGVLAALVAIVVGGVVGIASGFFRGLADTLLMRFVDVTLALPFLPLLIVLAVFLGRSLVTMVFVISVVIWARPARVLRSQVLSVRERGDVQASRAMGARPRHTLLHHVLPAVGPLIIAQFVRAANIAILLEASLSFLGLGDPTNKSWGTVLYYANSRGAFLTGAWLWWVLPTGLLISMVVLAFAFIGYALEERTDPRLSAGRPPMLAQTASLETARLDSLAAPARAEGAS